MYKELTPQEVAKILGEQGITQMYTRDDSSEEWQMTIISGVELGYNDDSYPFYNIGDCYNCCAIKIEPKKRFMTKEECMAWACTIGSSGWQVSHNDDTSWDGALSFCYTRPSNVIRRTVEWNNGKPIYGEPEKFEIEVEND